MTVHCQKCRNKNEVQVHRIGDFSITTFEQVVGQRINIIPQNVRIWRFADPYFSARGRIGDLLCTDQ